MDAVIRNRGYQTREDAGDIGGEQESSFGIDEPSTVRRILHWIDAVPHGRPFLVTYLPIAGHHPYPAPAGGPFGQDEEIDRYRNSLHYADAALGQLLRGLRRRGLEDKTLIHDENVRVPFVIALPGRHLPLRVNRVASLVDTAPTILDLLGETIPRSYQGRSLLERQERLALFCTDYSLALIGLRDGRWKLVHELDSGRSRLFDLEEDPDEQHNLADEHPDRVRAYRDHILRWSAAQKYRILHGRS
jgi:arylsulfatase A-like enzyme